LLTSLRGTGTSTRRRAANPRKVRGT
jgi:hypothetical protein